ncbi:MAG: CoA transferase [Cereibacter sphaeroides]|uniref:CoA transferase n=1 Tax=Cereibacter sphaeroides TaxID=1063 RepID=A0A2W5SCS9_CERSP|nr:MAG: CoA transferase [Cereibacter sphaeroides]
MTQPSDTPMALEGITVLDLTRVLAGPTATQMLGDLGATVIKIENPGTKGDDTRHWGPVYVQDAAGGNTDLSAYFTSSNRNKRSVAVDLARPEGQALVRALAARADIMVENYKVGGLVRYGLDHATMLSDFPGLIYCSITGFGQTGPHADKPGYDLMAQGYGGIMSLTGAPDGMPMKVGVAVADVMCGMYATIGILAALRHKERTGEGQHIDVGLVDTQMAWLVNEGVNYLTSGKPPQRRGNDHVSIVPYGAFAASDGHVIVAVGNDSQFVKFCNAMGLAALPGDERFATNPARTANRAELLDILRPALASQPVTRIVALLEQAQVPVGPIQTVGDALNSDQAVAREMVVSLPEPTLANGAVRVIGNPLKLSRTPIQYRLAPPRFGQHTDEVTRWLAGDASKL